MTSALLGIAAIVFIVYRQLRPRQVAEQSGARITVILAAIGVYEVAEAAHKVSSTATVDGIALTAVGLAVAAIFGVLRGRSVHLWREVDGTIWQRGGVVAVALWVLAMAAHIGLDYAGLGVRGTSTVTGASVLLFIAVSMGIQREVARYRAARMAPAPEAATVGA